MLGMRTVGDVTSTEIILITLLEQSTATGFTTVSRSSTSAMYDSLLVLKQDQGARLRLILQAGSSSAMAST